MNNSTIDHLLTQVQVLNRIKSSGLLGGQLLTQSGLDMCNEELSTIEAELDERQPESTILIGYGEEDMTGILPYPLTVPLFVNRGDFVTLLDGDGLPVGFEHETN